MDSGRNFGTQKVALACTWIFSALVAIGWLGIGHFYAPAPADLGLAETRVWFVETYPERIVAGCSILYVACGFLVPSSIQFIESKWLRSFAAMPHAVTTESLPS